MKFAKSILQRRTAPRGPSTLVARSARVAAYAIACAALLLGRACAADQVDFSRDIQPILSENCYFCHGPDAESRAADLRLDQESTARAVIEPGNPAASELLRRVMSDDEFERMPPPETKRKLTTRQIELLEQWIKQGAPWGTHWAYTPITRPDLPEVVGVENDRRPTTNPIDRFVLAQLQTAGLEPAPQAETHTLIRRVTLDLTGLPPTPEQIARFHKEATATSSPDSFDRAYRRLVDRLLASPAFGERMAWDWLDAARYADSNGYQGDRERTMWPWRDWVVRAFNENLPFDEFTIWQLAGDLLPKATFEQQLATGFCRNHMINGEGGRIPEENRVDYVMDMTETAGTVWLALTLNCCRCHDHKFDPLTQRDYYALSAFFNQTPVDGGGGDPQTPPVLAAPTREQRSRIEQLEQQLAAIDEQLNRVDEEGAEAAEKTAAADASAKAAQDSHREELKKEREQLEAERKKLRDAFPKVMVMQDRGELRPTYVLDRGLYNKPGEEVSADVPASLPTLPESAPRNRLALAQWLVSEDNPLTARVAVNRFWQQLFGVGLVKTSEDFGVQGENPANRELLDWLAAEFRDSGWDVKYLLRTIVLSRTYRQSSRVTQTPEGLSLAEVDPNNRMLARGPRYRLPSWMLRDQALAAAGLLSHRQGGPPVNVYQPPGVWEEATFGKKTYSQDHGEALYRRSLYIFWRRIVGPTLFFDNAARQVCTVKVFRTNTPLHALLTLNDVTYVEAARTLAERTLLEGGDTDEQRLDYAFQRLLARPAAPEEREVLLAGLERTKQTFTADPAAAAKLIAIGESSRNDQINPNNHAAWTALCLALLNLDETLSKE